MTAKTREEIRPQKGPQEAFLSSAADIAIYGGAAGGGKSWSLLVEPVRHIKNPDFGAVIFRRSYPQIMRQGGLWDESHKLYPKLGGKPNSTGLYWTFPSGARVSFCHLQNEDTVLDWQGSQVPLIEFDELTHFTRRQFFYMLSRNRSLCGVRPYVRAGCNPDAESWVAEFIEWWIDQRTGLPIPERAAKLRWFIQVNEKFEWADTREELWDLVRERVPQDAFMPKTVTFIPAKLSDNQILMKADPGYLANLLAQPLVERERLLGGNWKVRPAAGLIFNRAWFEPAIEHELLPSGGEECRFWDFAATEKKLKGDDPDFTAGTKIRKVNGAYYVRDVIAVQKGPVEVERLFEQVCRDDYAEARASGVRYMARWEIEPGSAAKKENIRLMQLLAGMDAKGVSPQGDKIQRAKSLANQSEVGNVRIVRARWNEEFKTHLHHQPEWPHDDIMDSASGAFNELAGGKKFFARLV